MPASPPTPQPTDRFIPGQQVVIIQQIPQRDVVWTTRLRGEVVRFEQQKTGSWFAHAKDDRLWLDRLTIRKPDGELVTCVLDGYTHIEMVFAPAEPKVTAGA